MTTARRAANSHGVLTGHSSLGVTVMSMERAARIHVPVYDLDCGGARILEGALAAVEGVLSVRVNPATETAYLEVDPAELDGWGAAQAIARAGFHPGRPVEA